jgi:hypothetical protein
MGGAPRSSAQAKPKERGVTVEPVERTIVERAWNGKAKKKIAERSPCAWSGAPFIFFHVFNHKTTKPHNHLGEG